MKDHSVLSCETLPDNDDVSLLMSIYSIALAVGRLLTRTLEWRGPAPTGGLRGYRLWTSKVYQRTGGALWTCGRITVPGRPTTSLSSPTFASARRARRCHTPLSCMPARTADPRQI